MRTLLFAFHRAVWDDSLPDKASGVVVSWGRHPRQDRRTASDQKPSRVVVLRLTATARFSRSWSRQATWLCVKVTLPTFQGLWQAEAASNHCSEADALLSHHPIQDREANKKKENKNVRSTNKKERELRLANQRRKLNQIKKDMKASQRNKETPVAFSFF